MARGTHIYVKSVVAGIPYEHHGIDMGDGTVIHLAPADGVRMALHDASDRFSIRRDSLDVFCRGARPVTVRHADGPPAADVAAAAESYLGSFGYSLVGGNCEHFARLCASGRAESRQIDMSEATVSAFASLTTKAFWSATRFSSRIACRSVAKVHPACMLADGVEIAALAISCRRGLDSDRARCVARLSGSFAAVGIGAVIGGPAGAALSLAAHSSSTALADRLCKVVRQALS